jgi:hypothetical protein
VNATGRKDRFGIGGGTGTWGQAALADGKRAVILRRLSRRILVLIPAVLHRGEQPGSEKIGQLASIDPIILVPRLQQCIPPWVTHQHLRDMGLEQVVQPGRAGSFFEGEMRAAAQPVNKLEDGCRFGFEDGLHHQLAGGIQNRSRDRCLMDVPPNIISVIQEGATFL